MKEEVIIVNESDEIIWYKDRWTILKEDIYRVSALLIKNSKWEFLLAQRKLTKKNNPWWWSFSVAGTVEKSETYDSNISKEIEEEIGIFDLKYSKLFKKRIIGKHNYYCQFYFAILDVELDYFTIQEEEVENIRWFSLDEIKKWSFEWNKTSKTILENIELFN
jgi:isopentenyldiphosphate isomerase